MKYVFLFIVIIYSCKPKQTEAEKLVASSQKFLDSIDRAEKVDSMVKKTLANVYWDTVGVSQAPVKVTNVRLVKREYSNYRDIELTYKNVCAKKIDAIKFAWYGETAFGDPADMGNSLNEGFGGGYTDRSLSPGKVSSGQWSILSGNAKKNLKAWPTEIAFNDGTKWKSSYK
jgi:hypothetical protein